MHFLDFFTITSVPNLIPTNLLRVVCSNGFGRVKLMLNRH